MPLSLQMRKINLVGNVPPVNERHLESESHTAERAVIDLTLLSSEDGTHALFLF